MHNDDNGRVRLASVAPDARKAPAARPLRFGAVLGIAPGGVAAYSCDYDTADEREYPNRASYRSYLDDIYMGYKWQCVEFARRWLYLNRGWIFDDVAMAYDIFDLTDAKSVGSDERLPLRSFGNGSKHHPEPGCLLIWDEGGEFEHTGHVAIVTEVFPDRLRVAEQNLDHCPWPAGCDYSRELNATISPQGEYWIECSFGDATILGWVIQTADATHAEVEPEVDTRLYNLTLRKVPDRGQDARAWLNLANPDEAAFVTAMEGQTLTTDPADRFTYFCMSESALELAKHATNTLHAMFMQATDHVLRDDALLARFGIPASLWPKIHQSWSNRRNQMITGRFDFTLTDRGLKVYEYNADSASCHMECGKVQGKWANHYGCRDGDDAGEALQAMLHDAWQDSDVDNVLHIMQDDDPEETYHARFMAEAMEEAGIRTKILLGVDGLSWAEDGRVCDPDGVPIHWVWKTWAWETALDQIRAECDDDPDKLQHYRPGERHDAPPRLVDVLLRQEVMVYEPLWTLIPSNKAILPILCQLFPDHEFLPHTGYALDDVLRQRGYVSKPIVGRCGSNIVLVGRDAAVLEQTGGNFEHRDVIYQELCPLPRLGGFNVQLNTFSVAGVYAGACIRADRALVINQDSDTMPLRVVEDKDLLDDFDNG